MQGLNISGKSIIVTGGASGIGEATVRLAALAGAKVTIADLNVEAGVRLVKHLQEQGCAVQFIRTDISDEQQVQDMVALALKTFGRLDGAFNNAGVAGFNQSNLGADEPAKFSALPLDVYRRVQEVNVVGTFICMKHEIIAMLQTGGGAIVNTASFSGIFASPGAADYVASKHAVIGLTKSAALDYATQNIRVNAVLPGAIRTPMLDMVFKSDGRNKLLAAAHPNGRLGEPEEIAQAALWLLSDAASLITGISMSADGGLSMI